MRVERGAPQGIVADIAQGHGQLLGLAVDPHMPEELQAGGWRKVQPVSLARRLFEDDLRPEGRIERIGTEGAGMDRA